MRSLAATALWWMLGACLAAPAVAQTCPSLQHAYGVARVVEIDAARGPLFGRITRLKKEASFLRRREVVLTFDDGPVPSITRKILDILDQYCTKATFFPVGRMALASPGTVKEVAARGHTLGSHTWSHSKLREVPLEQAKEEIERGFAAVALAAGRPIAPFFRFPGLGDSEAVIGYLKSRGISTFTVDVVSNDSFIADADTLARTALEQVEAHQGGIILFHDIKPQTVKALPIVLGALKERGYTIVHLKPKSVYRPLEAHVAAMKPLLGRADAASALESSAGLEGLGDDTGATANGGGAAGGSAAQKPSKPVPVARSSSPAKRPPPAPGTAKSSAGLEGLGDDAGATAAGPGPSDKSAAQKASEPAPVVPSSSPAKPPPAPGTAESSAGLEGLGDDVDETAAGGGAADRSAAQEASEPAPVVPSSSPAKPPPSAPVEGTSDTAAPQDWAATWAATLERARRSAKTR